MAIGPGELIRVEERYYILASSSRVDDRTRVLKEGETFAVLDRFGDFAPVGLGELGLYHDGTRFLSRLGLTLGRERPLLLSSNVSADDTVLAVDLTNPDLPLGNGLVIRRGTLHLSRQAMIWQGVLYEQVRVVNYGGDHARVSLDVHVESDYADLFEVRGVQRPRRGALQPVARAPDGLTLSYHGLDGVLRRTRVASRPHPSEVCEQSLRFDLSLDPHEEKTLLVAIACESGNASRPLMSFEEARGRAGSSLGEERRGDAVLTCSNSHFEEWVRRAMADIHLMLTATPYGLYPYAGVPWYNTVFGRDGILTALETLWVNPDIARGVLRALAANQADQVDEFQDAEPGKILHEARLGEMAAMGEVPFGRYYGSVDSTPLFLILAGAYFERVREPELLDELWPSLEKALGWMDRWGDRDQDGFLEYQRRKPSGLANQGWKDSQDSVFHADGSPAEGPIALCEVQAYAFAARRGAARLARKLGQDRRAIELFGQAERLRDRFEREFWCEDLGTYALALDGEKRPCRVRASNAGHCLWTGIASGERARRLRSTLLGRPFFSGWGLRTLAADEVRYNPMSYHNGSVWPHDTAIAAAGLARYGYRRAALSLLNGLFRASAHFEMHRLPELFCGFERRPGEGPTLYPVACSPQAWASAAPFLMLQACLGLFISARQRRVTFHRPILPATVRELEISGLRVGEDRLDLAIVRHAHDVGVQVLGRIGKVEVRVLS